MLYLYYIFVQLLYILPVLIFAWVFEALIFRRFMSDPVWGWVASTSAATLFLTVLAGLVSNNDQGWIFHPQFIPAFLLTVTIGVAWRIHRRNRGDFRDKSINPDIFK